MQPRLTAVSNVVTDILGKVAQGAISEYHDVLKATLQDLKSFRDAKIANSVTTPTGSNVVVQSQQGVKVSFPGVYQSGITVTTPTEPGAAFGVPGGFILSPQLAFTVETSAIYVGPVTTCFTVPSVTDAALFATLVVLHSEGAPVPTLVDRTISRDFATKTICARTDSLSPFVVALKRPATPQVPTLPQIVINRSISRNTTTGEITVQLSITNAGSVGAASVQLSVARINATSGTPLPQSLGTVTSGSTVTATVRFPASVGTTGSSAVLTIAGTYTGGSFNTASRITLP
jgi:hypothetical protein